MEEVTTTQKKIIILGYALKNLIPYQHQLSAVLNNKVKTDIGLVQDISSIDFSCYALVLVPNAYAFSKLRPVIKNLQNVVQYHRTVTVKGFSMLRSIPEESLVYIADKNKDMANDLAQTVSRFGISCNIRAISYDEITHIPSATLFTYSNEPDLKDIQHYDIGEVLLDTYTIAEIGMRLGEEFTIRKKNLTSVYKPIVPTSPGLDMILRKLSKYESIVLILQDTINNGYIEVDLNRKLYSCNEKAIQFLNIPPDDYHNLSIENYIDKQIVDQVYEKKRIFKNEVTVINGESYVYHIWPNLDENNFFGSTVTISPFSQTEKIQSEIRNKVVRKGHRAKYNFSDLIGQSDKIHKCIETAKRFAHSNFSVVIEGESGTGKEIFAQAIHNTSDRKNAQFVAINCSALPASILESELFGYAEGAFTGAKRGGKAGLFELANQGTLFLDEIGELPMEVQAKLLRVLQEKVIMRVGGDTVISVDVRIIAATNRNLESLVAEGNFRQDLYYRLKVLPLYIPPLRERKTDIPMLHDYFKKEAGGTYTLSPASQKLLLEHAWKGNVRELQNFVEYCICLEEPVIEPKHFPFYWKVTNPEEITDADINTGIEYRAKFGANAEKYLDVLNIFVDSDRKKIRLGRRSVLTALNEKELSFTEGEVRHIMSELEKLELIDVGRGRAGSQITALGKKVYQQLSSNGEK